VSAAEAPFPPTAPKPQTLSDDLPQSPRAHLSWHRKRTHLVTLVCRTQAHLSQLLLTVAWVVLAASLAAPLAVRFGSLTGAARKWVLRVGMWVAFPAIALFVIGVIARLLGH
jgi:hypothetical protein